jgi:2-aminoadipate transaminase
MIPEALEEQFEILKKSGDLPRVKLLYLMTYYQNPKGTSYSEERRELIWDILLRYSTPENYIYLLEDAAYFDLNYDGPKIPFMKALDPNNERTILALTFSKGFAPGLRLGYGHLPADLVAPVFNQKGNHDFGSSNFSQTIALRALQSGYYDEHCELLRRRYAAKRDLMIETIRAHFPPEVEYMEPKGGLYVWATLPDGVSTSPGSAFFEEALGREVLYVPGCYCYAQEEGRKKPENQMRLCYGYIEEEPMAEGLRRLASTLRSCL